MRKVTEDIKDTIEWWKHKVFLLEKRIEQLELENFEFRRTICETVDRLKAHNLDMKVVVESNMGVLSECDDDNVLRPKFKKAKWKKD